MPYNWRFDALGVMEVATLIIEARLEMPPKGIDPFSLTVTTCPSSTTLNVHTGKPINT